MIDEDNQQKVFRRDLSKIPPKQPDADLESEDVFMDFIKRFCDFSGTSGVAEFLTYAVIALVLITLPSFMLYEMGLEKAAKAWILLMNIITFIPLLSVAVRRLHDTGKSGIFVLVGLIPVAGGLVLFIMLLLPGDGSMNNPYRETKL